MSGKSKTMAKIIATMKGAGAVAEAGLGPGPTSSRLCIHKKRTTTTTAVLTKKFLNDFS